MSNMYYHPEDFGLEIVEMLDEDLSYEFNTLIVWKSKETGKMYYDSDSGCSCPTPFEDSTMENVTPVNVHTFHQLESIVKDFPVSADEKSSFLTKVRANLQKSSLVRL